MSTNYPGALDNTSDLINNATDATVTATTHAQAHNNVADSLIAIETALGTNPKGSYASVAAWLADALVKTPGAAQTITPSGDTVPLILKSGNTLNVSNMQEWRDASSVIQAFMDKSFILSTQGLKIAGTALASTHLSDGATLAHLNSPALTGTPTAPTAAVDTNTTQLATTAYVVGQGYLKSALAASTYAPLNSPVLTGTPTAPTPTSTDNSTRIATTAFVKSQTVGFGTSLPGSPTDGQEYILTDSITVPTYRWRFRYNASSTSSYKWEFVGGAPVNVRVDTAEATGNNFPSDLATVGPSFVIPRSGEYEVSLGCQTTVQFNTTVGVGITRGAVGATLSEGINNSTAASGADDTLWTCLPPLAGTAGDTWKLQYGSVAGAGGGSNTFSNRRMSIIPVRVS